MPRQSSLAPKAAAIWTRRESTVAKKLPIYCETAEVIIVRGRGNAELCPKVLILDADDFARGGSAELYRQTNGVWRVVWAQPLRGDRPWTAGVASDE